MADPATVDLGLPVDLEPVVEAEPAQPAQPSVADPGAEVPSADDLKALYADAVRLSAGAVADAEAARVAEKASMGERLRAEQDRLFGLIMEGVPGAVREAAAAGHRVATVLTFEGGDKLDEFSYLYMLKGPYTPDAKAEMRELGASPLLPRLRAALNAAGFRVWHAWQRATNDNALVVSW